MATQLLPTIEDIDISTSLASETGLQAPDALEQACLAARIADEFKAGETTVLDLRQVTPLFDFFVLCTGTSRRQMHAIAEEIDRVLKQHGTRRLGLEGYEESNWILQDYGTIVLHVMTPEAREHYDLEGLWADGLRIDWRE